MNVAFGDLSGEAEINSCPVVPSGSVDSLAISRIDQDM